MHKYIRLDHFQELMNLIDKRDSHADWTDEYEKYTKKVKKTVEWIERNAKDFPKGEQKQPKKFVETFHCNHCEVDFGRYYADFKWPLCPSCGDDSDLTETTDDNKEEKQS